ncbi:uncharacterized protein LOC127009910 [Eriocheir sinensis]|uniref:uncharacterized protein LOC127009910 n=1 Tax=Eriocheir sinensis TaxID=95602 RepID=UPI0021C970E2|nr:uncharacterized protein LOC127009910 [Eriocheir sinensis]
MVESFSTKAALHARIVAYERETKSNFVFMTKDKSFGVEDWRNMSHKNSLFWQIPSVPPDGIPFLSLGRKNLSCHFGKPKNKTKLDQKSKKMGCPAEIHIRHVVKFPEFRVERGASTYRKRREMQKLRKALSKDPDSLKVEIAYYAELPNPSDHNGHPLHGIAAGMLEKPDPLIKEEILNLVRDGVRKVSDIKRHINEFVSKVFVDEEVKDTSRRRFHPLDKDIRNLMHKAKTFKGHPEDYQETLRYLAEETQKKDQKPPAPLLTQGGGDTKPIVIRYKSKQQLPEFHRLPDFLKKQPREVVAHIVKRMKSNISKEDMIMAGEGEFRLRDKTTKGETYRVSFGSESLDPFCTCGDFHKYKLPCRHFCAIFEHYPEWNWHRLPAAYRDNLLFVSDTQNCYEVEVMEEPDLVPEVVLDDGTSALSDTSSDSSEKIYVKLPRKRKTTRQGLHVKCARVLRQIIDSVYLLKDIEYLQGLHHDLQCKLIEVQLQTPNDAEFHVSAPRKRRANSDGGNTTVMKRMLLSGGEEDIRIPKVEIRTVCGDVI